MHAKITGRARKRPGNGHYHSFWPLEFLWIPFGLQNASQTFKRFIDCVLRGLDFCCAYVDDILFASKNEEEHLRHLEEFFQRLDDYGLVVNADTCSFGRAEISFLGHIANDQGVRPLQAKVKAVKVYPNPRTTCKLRRFLTIPLLTTSFSQLRGVTNVGPPLQFLVKSRKLGRRTHLLL